MGMVKLGQFQRDSGIPQRSVRFAGRPDILEYMGIGELPDRKEKQGS